jgi:hypothetical protein
MGAVVVSPVKTADTPAAGVDVAEPYVLAETIVASDGTLIHIWAPRSCCERPRQPVPVAFEGERGRR